MPPKKSAKKKSRKIRTLEDDIRDAAGAIPNIIAAEMQKEAPISQQNTVHKKRILWIGVTTFSTLIFTLWVINAKNLIGKAGLRNNPEFKIVTSIEADLKTAFAIASDVQAETNPPAESVENLEKKVAESLSAVLNTSSTTTTTMPVGVTTTTDEYKLQD